MGVQSTVVVPLLLPFFILPGWESLKSVEVKNVNNTWVLDRKAGAGPQIEAGDFVTVHYSLASDGGEELANTTRVGLPFSFHLDGTDADSLLVQAVEGMRRGGTRLLISSGDRLARGKNPIASSDSQLILTVRVVASKASKVAKVDSKDAGRTERALEISRAPGHHGPARIKNPL